MKAIPTWYKSTMFRSKLEAQWAKLLDHYGMAWTYEVEGYEFNDGTRYLPDFWLPDSKQWLEVKGIMNDKDMHKCEMLAKESKHEVAIGYASGKMQLIEFSDCEPDGIWLTDDGVIATCRQCGGRYLMTWVGSYHCRCCGAYDGDHYLKECDETESVFGDVATIDVMSSRRQP